jgi:hypothetical protein
LFFRVLSKFFHFVDSRLGLLSFSLKFPFRLVALFLLALLFLLPLLES